MDFKKNYYTVLGVSETAETWEIRAAYRKLANKYHPDRNPENQEYEELTKEINEAKEVLLNADNRSIYDQYRNSLKEEKKQKAEEKKQKNNQKDDFENEYGKDNIKEPKKRKYTRSKTVVTETKLYVKGEISIKYYAPRDIEKIDNRLNEFYYQIITTEATAKINNTDIYNSKVLPDEFKEIFIKYNRFNSYVKKPINSILHSAEGDLIYDLDIKDLTIPEPKIELVVKHETNSYGTISGTFYGYVNHLEYHEEIEEVEECSGSTGRIETKFENGNQYKREEYYKTDCTTYWSNWVLIYSPKPSAQNTGTYNRRSKYSYTNYKTPSYSSSGCAPADSGCLSSGITPLLTIIYILFLIFTLPRLLPIFIFIGLIFLFSFISRFTGNRSFRWMRSLILLMFLFLFITAIFVNKRSYNPSPSPVLETVREKEKPKKDIITTDNSNIRDSLITYFRQWKDYDGKEYSGKYTLLASKVNQSSLFKRSIRFTSNSPQSYDRIIYDIKNNDSSSLSGVYKLFDSIKTTNRLENQRFAEIIVSFVQDIPYSLILDNACDPSLYRDSYIKKYLRSPSAICEPYQRFGINTPVEFLASLKGDCDTRTLLLYQILSHYDYDVTLLSSEQFGHSLIGINLPYSGVNYDYNGTRYVLWETTAPNMKPGVISPEVSNTNYWRISLKSK